MNVKIVQKNLNKPFTMPSYATPGSSGMDLCASLTEDVILMPGEVKLIDTNIGLEMPEGIEAQVRSRSGLAYKNQVFVLNSPGTVDCFSTDMKIKTINGDKYIKDLSINDIVLSYNIDSNEIEKDTIKVIIDKDILNINIIYLENGKQLEVTDDTLVYTDRGLKYAKDLTEEDEIFIFES